jgi:putative FmdB family regulatory protein
MPLFDYRCKKCGHQFEALVMGSTSPSCPSCQGKKLEKQLSVFAVSRGERSAEAREAVTPCGSCGDPRGPGACAWNN